MELVNLRILVLATNYPRPDGFISLQYIHSRNKWYIKKGIDVTVLSFGATYDYEIDGVRVCTFNTYKDKLHREGFDILVSHAPNLRNHYLFIKQNGKKFNKILFFFHGHEVLEATKIYPKPFEYTKRDLKISLLTRKIYDKIKLMIWRNYFTKHINKIHFVFVSKWMYNMFLKFVKVNTDLVNDKKDIIYNCIGDVFQKKHYDINSEKLYDFITIRSNLDGSKYGIDIVTKVAEKNPEYKFCVIGKGDFFKYNIKPDNLTWINKHLNHNEVVDFLNKSRCAFLPTRADAQGVMACEVATFGIPLITSDIEVCKEVFTGFENVEYINNNKCIDIVHKFNNLKNKVSDEKNSKYFFENTIQKEIDLFKKLKGQ